MRDVLAISSHLHVLRGHALLQQEPLADGQGQKQVGESHSGGTKGAERGQRGNGQGEP